LLSLEDLDQRSIKHPNVSFPSFHQNFGKLLHPLQDPQSSVQNRDHTTCLNHPCILSFCLLEAMNVMPSQQRRRVAASGEQIYPDSCPISCRTSRRNVCAKRMGRGVWRKRGILDEPFSRELLLSFARGFRQIRALKGTVPLSPRLIFNTQTNSPSFIPNQWDRAYMEGYHAQLSSCHYSATTGIPRSQHFCFNYRT
jgi:hypothetical protein